MTFSTTTPQESHVCELVRDGWYADDRQLAQHRQELLTVLDLLDLPNDLKTADLKIDPSNGKEPETARLYPPELRKTYPLLLEPRIRKAYFDALFMHGGIDRAWGEFKFTAGPGSITLLCYALVNPHIPGRFISPYEPGWTEYPMPGAPTVRWISLVEVLSVFAKIEAVAARAAEDLRWCALLLGPSELPPQATLATVLQSMPAANRDFLYRLDNAASGAVLSAQMKRAGLRTLIGGLSHRYIDAEILGSPQKNLADRPYFNAYRYHPERYGPKPGWDAAVIHFTRDTEPPMRPDGKHAALPTCPLSGIRLDIKSFSESNLPIITSAPWLDAGKRIAARHGWHPSTTPHRVPPNTRIGDRSEGPSYEADLTTMTLDDIADTMRDAVQELDHVHKLDHAPRRRSSGVPWDA